MNRAKAAAVALRARMPDLRLAAFDSWALRLLAPALLIGALIATGGEVGTRIAEATDPAPLKPVPAAQFAQRDAAEKQQQQQLADGGKAEAEAEEDGEAPPPHAAAGAAWSMRTRIDKNIKAIRMITAASMPRRRPRATINEVTRMKRVCHARDASGSETSEPNMLSAPARVTFSKAPPALRTRYANNQPATTLKYDSSTQPPRTPIVAK